MKKLIPIAVFLLAIRFAGNMFMKSIRTDSFDISSSYSQLDISSQKHQENKINSDSENKYIEYHFRNKTLLQNHFEKHGVEMGFNSPDEYEKAASQVINNPDALTKTEKEDGDYVFYLDKTNEFVILATDGYIRTYFLPDAGKAYFDRQ